MIKKNVLVMSLLLLTRNTFCESYALSSHDAKKIGDLIWKNEMGKRNEELVIWNQHESFPSFGIGHQIWMHEDVDLPFTQKFPLLCDYLQKNGVILPCWLEDAKTHGAPWKTRHDFLKDKQKIKELRTLLASTIDLQTYFMIDQLNKKWPLMLQAVPIEEQAALNYRFNLLRSSLLGTYALIDYLNFKGDGLNHLEEINGQRWGLLQVLLAMPADVNEYNVHAAFSLSASKILIQLIENSAPNYSRIKFLVGWIKRVSTYADKKIFREPVNIAITIDDQPMADTPIFTAQQRTEKFIAACAMHNCKAAFFCVGDSCTRCPKANETLAKLSDSGHFLANHSKTHSFLSKMSLIEFKNELLATEKILKPYSAMRKWFRYPYLDYGHEKKRGGSPEKKAAGLKIIHDLGYTEGFVSINTFDWYLDRKLQDAIKQKDRINFTALKKVYLELISEWAEFYINLYKKELKQTITHTLLLHANDINALFLPDILHMIKESGWNIVSPELAFQDLSWKEQANPESLGDDPATLNFTSINQRLQKAKVFTKK